MKRITIVGLCALATLALVAIAATAAQAQEGPFWKVCQKHVGGPFKNNQCKEEGPPLEWAPLRLEKGEKGEMTGKNAGNFVLASGKTTITCKKLKFQKGATIIGSTGANFGSSEETIEFEECVVTGEGSFCKPYSEKVVGTKEEGVIRTQILVNKLSYPKETLVEGEKLLVLFVPKTPGVLAKIKFFGKGCTLGVEVLLEGSIAGEAWQGGAAVLLGKEELSLTNEVNFPNEPIGLAQVEVEGEKSKVEPKMTFGKALATLQGRYVAELTSKEAWGVFNK
jgi:hypothetical protein